MNVTAVGTYVPAIMVEVMSIVANVAAQLDQVSKIVGVSDDLDGVQRCEADARKAFGQLATANRSQPYYLDVTNKDANKGAVVDFLSRSLGVPVEEIATIGDQPTDVVDVYDSAGNPVTYACTALDGTYTISGLAAGAWWGA